MFWVKKFRIKTFFGSKGLKICWVIFSYPKRFFVKKKILVGLTLVGGGLMTPPPENKFLGRKKFRVRKNFGSKIFFGSNIFWVKKILGQRNFWVKMFLVKKFKVKIFFGSKGLKVCWVILSYPKRFFVKKKILLGLTLVGEGLMTPAPRK